MNICLRQPLFMPHEKPSHIYLLWKRLVRGRLTNERLRGNLSYKLDLVKELFSKENFAEILSTNTKRLPDKSWRYHNWLLLSCSSGQEVSIVLKNIILSCRMFQTDQQTKFYTNLERLLMCGCRRSQAEPDEANMSIDYNLLFSYLLDFDALPITYSTSSKNAHDHRCSFAKKVWKQLPLIVASTQTYVTNHDRFSESLQSIWEVLTQPRIIRATRWKFNSEEEVRVPE
jgi:hypothetical protein